jgi:hypothetical protein
VGPTDLAYRQRLVARFKELQARGEKVTSQTLVGHNLPGRYTKLRHLLEQGVDFVVEPSGRGPAVYFLRPLSSAAERWLDGYPKNAARRFGAVEVHPNEMDRVLCEVRRDGLSCALDEGGRTWKGRLVRS